MYMLITVPHSLRANARRVAPRRRHVAYRARQSCFLARYPTSRNFTALSMREAPFGMFEWRLPGRAYNRERVARQLAHAHGDRSSGGGGGGGARSSEKSPSRRRRVAPDSVMLGVVPYEAMSGWSSKASEGEFKGDAGGD